MYINLWELRYRTQNNAVLLVQLKGFKPRQKLWIDAFCIFNKPDIFFWFPGRCQNSGAKLQFRKKGFWTSVHSPRQKSPLDIPRSKFSGYQHVWTNPTHRRLNNLVRVGVIPLAPGKDSSWFHAWQLGIPNDMDFPWNEIMEWNEISAEILSNKSVLLAITWSFHCHSSSTFAT